MIPLISNAQIGYTKAECDRKYGNSVPNDNGGFVYNYGGLEISIYMSEEKCWQIHYKSERKFSKSKKTLLIKRNVKEKYKLTIEDKRTKETHYKSKNYYIDCTENTILITYDPS